MTAAAGGAASAAAATAELARGVLAGQPRPIGRAISEVERDSGAVPDILRLLFARTGRARILGITGPPGAGKSTLVQRLAQAYRKRGVRVGIVAVDPSSPFTGGAILGDRIRMSEIYTDPGIFIRSMATRGALGGLARATSDAVDVLDAAGFEVILVETVGVGQDEVDIVRAADTIAVVLVPGQGDDIQAIKAGILEIADVHVVSKCDRPDANRSITDLKSMLALGLSMAAPTERERWVVPVVATASVRDEGIADLVAAIDRHRDFLARSGEIAERRRRINERRLLRAGEEILRDEFVRQRDAKVLALLRDIDARRTSPHSAARELLAHLNLHMSEGEHA